MKETKVPALYIVEDRINTPEEINTLGRLLSKIITDKYISTDSKGLMDILAQNNWYAKGEMTGEKRAGNPSVILSGFDWDYEGNNPMKQRKYISGEPGKFVFADYRDKAQLRCEKGVMCNSGFEIHSAFGCLHSCTYCHVGNALTIMLDTEKFIEKLDILMKNNEWQRLYKYDNQSDIFTLEPEYGATKKLVQHFAQTDKTLMLYTKSDNVDSILDLEHRGRTVVCWTMSCGEVADKYELGAPGLDARVEAARKCWTAGYGTRVRFSPIIPIENWKEKNAEMIEKVFTTFMPEVVSLNMLCHMNSSQANLMFPNMGIAPRKTATEYELFRHDDRTEVYKFFVDEIRKYNNKVKIAPCLETEKIWKDIGALVNGNPNDFYCCCGAKCA